NSEAIFHLCNHGDFGQQSFANLPSTILLANVDILKEDSGTAFECGIVMEKECVPGWVSIPLRDKHSEFRPLSKSIAQQSGLGDGRGQVFEISKLVNETYQQRCVAGFGRANRKHRKFHR